MSRGRASDVRPPFSPPSRALRSRRRALRRAAGAASGRPVPGDGGRGHPPKNVRDRRAAGRAARASSRLHHPRLPDASEKRRGAGALCLSGPRLPPPRRGLAGAARNRLRGHWRGGSHKGRRRGAGARDRLCARGGDERDFGAAWRHRAVRRAFARARPSRPLAAAPPPLFRPFLRHAAGAFAAWSRRARRRRAASIRRSAKPPIAAASSRSSPNAARLTPTRRASGARRRRSPSVSSTSAPSPTRRPPRAPQRSSATTSRSPRRLRERPRASTASPPQTASHSARRSTSFAAAPRRSPRSRPPPRLASRRASVARSTTIPASSSRSASPGFPSR